MKLAAKRANNRNDALLGAAAELFATKGFRETTMRDIAGAAGMLPGSIYYHHGSKDDLLLEVYEAGVETFVRALTEALQPVADPWERLRRGMALHIAAITRDDAFIRVVNRVWPKQVPKHQTALIALRDRYERCFGSLIDDLPLAPWVDRRLLRLMLLGAGNQVQFWFDPDGRHSAEEIGQLFARLVIEPIARMPDSPPAPFEGDAP